MIRSLAKFGIWFVVGVGSIAVLLGNTSIHTPWKYTVHSNIPAGTQITLIQPNGEPVTMSVPEGQSISGSKTLDVGAPIALISAWVMSGILAFGLKARHHRPMCG